jgi:vitamin B12 transporter
MKFNSTIANIGFAKTTVAVALTLNLSLSSANNEVDEKIVITGSKFEQSINDVLANITVISREEIELAQAATAIELLERFAGLDVVKQGSKGQNASLFIRGTNSGHTLVLVDGLRVGAATLGTKQLTSIPTTQIERIEIIRGPRSVIWGADAIGGVIHIITRKMNPNDVALTANIGSNGYKKGSASLGFGNEENRFSITASRESETGFSAIDYRTADTDDYQESDDDGFVMRSILVRGDMDLNETWSVGLSAQKDDGEAGYDSSGANFGEFSNKVLSAKVNQVSEYWTNQMVFGKSGDDAQLYRQGDTTASTMRYTTNRDHISWNTAFQQTEELDLFGGLDWYQEDIHVAGTEFTTESRAIKAGFIGVAFVGDQLLSDVAIRSDNVEGVGSEMTYNLGLGYQVNSELLISGNLATGFKAPTFNDLYYPWGGNSELVAETSKNKELSAKYNKDAYSLQMSVYQNDITNLIQWAPLEDGSWTPQNVAAANIFGKELIVKFDAGSMQHEIQLSHVHAIDGGTNQQLMRRAKKKVAYQVTMPFDDLYLTGQIQYLGDRPDNYAGILDSYTIANIFLNYEISDSFNLQFKVTNLLDEDYTQVTSYDWTSGNIYPYNTAGREIYVGFSYRNF